MPGALDGIRVLDLCSHLSGPDRDRGGFGLMIQGKSGLMAVCGAGASRVPAAGED